MSPDILVITAGGRGGDVSGISWVEVREAGKHPAVHKSVPHNKELSDQLSDKSCLR